MATSKEFAAALKKKTKQFKKARKAKPGSFNTPEIEDGSYVAHITMAMRLNSDGKMIAAFKWTIARGANLGKSYTKDIWLDDDDKEREQGNFDELSKCLQTLGYDVDDYDASDLLAIADEITKEKPLAKISLKNFTAKSGNKYINCYINEILEDEDGDEHEDEDNEEEEDEDEEDQDEETASEDEDEDGDEDEDDEEDDEDTVEKGATVKYKRKVHKVTSSNQKKQICTIKHAKSGSVHKNVAWDDVIVMD